MSSKTKKTLKEEEMVAPEAIAEIAEEAAETAEPVAAELTPDIHGAGTSANVAGCGGFR